MEEPVSSTVAVDAEELAVVQSRVEGEVLVVEVTAEEELKVDDRISEDEVDEAEREAEPKQEEDSAGKIGTRRRELGMPALLLQVIGLLWKRLSSPD